jgi:hypothetical protein
MSIDSPRDRERILAEIEELQKTERLVSDGRRELHRRIDAAYLRAPLEEGRLALIMQLERDERAVSATRNGLHRRIDTLRASIGLPPVRRRDSIHDAA